MTFLGGHCLEDTLQARYIADELADWVEARFGRHASVAVTDPRTGIEGRSRHIP